MYRNQVALIVRTYLTEMKTYRNLYLSLFRLFFHREDTHIPLITRKNNKHDAKTPAQN